jgi:ribonuclease HI
MIEIYIDGLAEPNPGIGTFGYLVLRDGVELLRGHGFDGESVTNNHAEYAGLIAALAAANKFSKEEVVVRSDSSLLVNQMSGTWKVSKKAFKNQSESSYVEKYLEALQAAKRFPRITFQWVPRDQNSRADELSRVAYRERITRRRR